MTQRRALAMAVIASVGAVAGCAHSGSVVVATPPSQPQEVQVLAASTGAPELITLGAGDMLGQRIHVFDVYIAAMEQMGPLLEPFGAPADQTIVWAPLGPVTGDVALAMVTW